VPAAAVHGGEDCIWGRRPVHGCTPSDINHAAALEDHLRNRAAAAMARVGCRPVPHGSSIDPLEQPRGYCTMAYVRGAWTPSPTQHGPAQHEQRSGRGRRELGAARGVLWQGRSLRGATLAEPLAGLGFRQRAAPSDARAAEQRPAPAGTGGWFRGSVRGGSCSQDGRLKRLGGHPA